MKNLVLKDIRLLGFLNIPLILVPLVLGSIGPRVGSNHLVPTFIYAIATLVSIYLLVIRITVNDMKSNANSLLISLPVKKFDIVRSRYISVLLYSIVIAALIFLSSNISDMLGGIVFSSGNGATFSLVAVAFTLSVVIFFLSINIPLQYHSPRKTQIFNGLLYASIIIFPNIYDSLGLDFLNPELLEKILSLNLNLLAPMLLGISLVIYMVSSFVSKAIFENKEF